MKLALDVRLLLWTLITFGGLMAILAKFAFKPLQHLLEERERHIRESLDEAKRIRDEAEGLRRQGLAHIEEAREASRKLIDESRKVVAELQAEGRKQAREEAETTIRRGREEIEKEMRRSIDGLRGAVANISIQVAQDIIKDNLDASRHGQLVDEYIRQLKAEHDEPKS